MSKYQPLADYLATLEQPEIEMSFADIEAVLRSELPAVARRSPAFWANSRTDDSHNWAHRWLRAGWESAKVDVPGRSVVFRRTGTPAPPRLSPKQQRILTYLAGQSGWSTRQQTEDVAGRKGFSEALAAPTSGPLSDGSLEALGLVDRREDGVPFQYRITTLGEAALRSEQAPGKASDEADFALVLAENEVYAAEDFGWADQTGEQYEFPNSYKSRIKPGRPFIYYRGRVVRTDLQPALSISGTE